MPRLSPFLLRHARHQDPLLVPLLRPCQDLESACNELRWLREHALKTVNASSTASAWRYRLHKLCLERSKGKPLQYILGTQPFGDLEILCKPGVLIPRCALIDDIFSSYGAQLLIWILRTADLRQNQSQPI